MAFKYFEQGVYRILRDGMGKNEQGVVMIFDWDGFSLANFLDVDTLKLAIRQLAMMDKIYRVLNVAFLINSNKC